MGLSSSQARLLNLTARMHQIEYKAARLEAQKLQMANESTRVYEEYLDAMDKTKIQYKVLNTDGSVTYNDIASYDNLLKAGYALDFNGRVYDGSTKVQLGKDGKYYDTAADATAAGTTVEESNVLLDFDRLCKDAYGATSTPTGNDVETVITNLINSGSVTIATKRDDGKFAQESDFDFADYETSVSTDTGLQEVTDEVNLKKAEAKYEADMKQIDLKDRKFDTDLAALDTERNAIKSEMETLKSVAKENVERTFKLFS
jgi:hypothetical protein